MTKFAIALFLFICIIISLSQYVPALPHHDTTHLIPTGSPLPSLSYQITAYYHDPLYFKLFHREHTGIDLIPSSMWYREHPHEPVILHATISGIGIRYYEQCSGNAVVIINKDFIVYLGHIATFLYKNRAHITYKEPVAIMGESGTKGVCVTGPHVHYQIYQKTGDKYGIVNPLPFLQ